MAGTSGSGTTPPSRTGEGQIFQPCAILPILKIGMPGFRSSSSGPDCARSADVHVRAGRVQWRCGFSARWCSRNRARGGGRERPVGRVKVAPSGHAGTADHQGERAARVDHGRADSRHDGGRRSRDDRFPNWDKASAGGCGRRACLYPGECARSETTTSPIRAVCAGTGTARAPIGREGNANEIHPTGSAKRGRRRCRGGTGDHRCRGRTAGLCR